ncbi:MAG: AAA family ATPase [Xenococcaceae cyanobacterium]
MEDWHFFFGDGESHDDIDIEKLLPPPPWRRFRKFEKMTTQEQLEIKKRWQKIQELADSEDNERGQEKGKSFRIHTEHKNDGTKAVTEASKNVLNAVNAAIYLRRPLLVTGRPGSGKTSLAYAIAHEIKLGPVLSWPITARSTLREGLYRYDAIARLQDAELKKQKDIGQYIQLGPVGTAFLPSHLPRVLLIDEIDKSDINLPNDLLHLFEEGSFEISELVRQAKASESNPDSNAKRVLVRTEELDIEAPIYGGRVRCCAFPIVVMTSNGERDFPPAFLRRCLRVRMPDPQAEALKNIVKAHFGDEAFEKAKSTITQLIDEFLVDENRATDQLLNTIYLLTNTNQATSQPPDEKALKELLFQSLTSAGE